MSFPVMFVWFIIAIVVFRYRLRKNDKASEDASRTFWQKEQASLVVRKKRLGQRRLHCLSLR